ncbi:MAG: hypothetical protein ACI93R_002515 [Flavobacteriales bacterium]|jgi:uncharacterized protein YjbI with pentapeptide repeats/class 3 adenylate cyclase
MQTSSNLSMNDAVALILQGPKSWNAWRKQNPSARPVLDGIELTQLKLSGIDFSGLSLQKAVLFRCDLSHANLTSADFRHAQLKENNFGAAKLIAAFFQMADLSGSNLSHANILTASTQGARLDGIDFRGHDLQGLDLRSCSLISCNLSSQNLVQVDLSRACLDRSKVDGSNFSQAIFNNTSARGIDFSQAQLEAASFKKSDLSDSSFKQSRLNKVDFSQANLSRCDLRGAIIQQLNLTKATINGCKFWKVQTQGWTLNQIHCKYAFWDEKGLEKTHYKTHEFERIYAASIAVRLRFPYRLSSTEISTLPILIEHLQGTFWGTSIRLKSINDDAGGSEISFAIDETGDYHPYKLKEAVQDEINRLQIGMVLLRKNTKIQLELKDDLAKIRENFWPSFLELAAQNGREHVRNLTILFMDLKGFSLWSDDELSEKLSLFRGLVKPILSRWGGGHPNMEGDSLRITFTNATAGLSCACMMRSVLIGAGFQLRIGVELGEVFVIHNEITNTSDLEGSAVSMAARIEAAATEGEVIVSDKVRHYTEHKGLFEFNPRQVQLKKGIGDKHEGDVIECYSVRPLKPLQDLD